MLNSVFQEIVKFLADGVFVDESDSKEEQENFVETWFKQNCESVVSSYCEDLDDETCLSFILECWDKDFQPNNPTSFEMLASQMMFFYAEKHWDEMLSEVKKIMLGE